jgi:hypothetical protein
MAVAPDSSVKNWRNVARMAAVSGFRVKLR